MLNFAPSITCCKTAEKKSHSAYSRISVRCFYTFASCNYLKLNHITRAATVVCGKRNIIHSQACPSSPYLRQFVTTMSKRESSRFLGTKARKKGPGGHGHACI